MHRLVLGMASMWLGDADRARELLVEAARLAEDDNNHLAYLCAEGYQALLAVNRGDVALAESLVEDAEPRSARRSATRISWPCSRLWPGPASG